VSTLKTCESSVFQVLYGVPQGCFLRPLLFILYITPLSTVISKSSANHLYANYWYTKCFLSSSAADVAYNISHLEHTISKVYNWMSSNFLSLNLSKTEFLLVGLPRQLSKLSNPIIHLPNNVTLSPVHAAPNVRVI
jgi:Reverse transcriptase (RNA-dependent DNA polymerase)